MIGAAPSDLVATAISSRRIDLTWKNNSVYDYVRIWRKKAAEAWTPYLNKPGSYESMEDKGMEDGVQVGLTPETSYCYKVWGELRHPYETTDLSYGGVILAAGGYEDCVDSDIGKQVKEEGEAIGELISYDNTLRRWFIDSATIVETGSEMTIADDGAGEGTATKPTNCARTFAPLFGPTEVVALPISDIEIEITFKDNSEDETHHNIQRRISTAPPDTWVSVVAVLEPNREFFRDGGLFLDKELAYTDCVPLDIGKQVHDNDGAIGPLRAYDNTRRRWLIDSDGHAIAEAESMTIADDGAGKGTVARATTGLIKGSSYTYQVRAEEEGGHTDWVSSNLATTISEPADPTELEASDVKDTSLQLSWKDNSTNETGFRIEQKIHDEDWVEIAVIGANITEFLVTGLTATTRYYFRVRAYNAAGNSTNYTNVTDNTMPASYVPTEFEKWIRNPNIEPVYLAEIYTKMDLTGFEEHEASCYKKTIGADDRGIDILEVFEDGDAYEKKDNPDQVKDNVNTFHFDYNARKLYIHATGGVNPEGSGLLIEGAFWLYFSTHKDIEFNNNFYLPLLTKEDIPDITQEIKPYYEGSFLISSGSIAFMNGKIMGEHFFDKKYANYTWENSKVILKAGKDDFIYEDFKAILTSLIDQKSCNDNKIIFTLRDLRQEMERKLILNKYWANDQGDGRAFYPDIEEDFIGEPIPLCFGTKYNVVAVPINVGRKKYNFHDGRSKSVEEVYKNWVAGDTPLVEDVNYFVDLQRSIITFARDTFELGPEDIIDVAFIGSVNSADEPIANGAEVFKYFMNEHYGLLNSDLNLDSIYATKHAKTNPLSIFLYKDTSYREIVRTIEHSTEAFTFQDPEGRLGLKIQLDAAESNAKYIRNYNIFNHQQSKTRKLLFWKVNIFWNENPQLQEWEVKSAQDDDIWYRYKIRNELNIYSYFSAPSAAQDLADAILTLLNKETIENTVPMLLFDVMAGDIVKFSRDRFYDADGKVEEGSEINLRIIRISKSPASGQTTIITEIVADA